MTREVGEARWTFGLLAACLLAAPAQADQNEAKTLAKKLKIPNLRLDATCIDYLLEYSWPGNVRELENILERAAVLSENEVIIPESLPPIIVHSAARRRGNGELLTRSLAEVEQDHIQAVLESTDHNRSHAARILGISPTTLWRKLKEA